MLLIGMTPETILPAEAEAVNALFRAGLQRLHVRKPHASAEELEQYIACAGEGFYERIVLHDHFRLAGRFGLKGVHLNSRNPVRPDGCVAVSRSCHTFEELREAEGFEYLFFSPVFASLSKPGYRPRYMPEELRAARRAGTIDRSVVALGGIEAATIPAAAEYGFGGVAVLGALWGDFAADREGEAVLDRFYILTEWCERL